MSVRVNLLPEARMVKLKNQQLRRLVTVICLLAVSSVGIILVVLLLLLGARNVQSNLNKTKIDELDTKVAAKKDTEQDLAWFNTALKEQDTLINNRILISQLFDRLQQSTPKDVKIVDVSVDSKYLVKASVKAPGLNEVALFMNALKTYNVEFGSIENLPKKQVFKGVDVNTVTKKSTASADFEVSFTVDEDLVRIFRTDATKASSSPSPSPSGGAQ